jgi:hypothetical protein
LVQDLRGTELSVECLISHCPASMRSAKMKADSEAMLFLWSPGALLFFSVTSFQSMAF